VVAPEDQKQLRDYLLGRLPKLGEEEVEIRLLSDADYSTELDIIAEELIDEHVEGKLPATDLPSFQQYFLRSRIRQEKLDFALALKKCNTQLSRRTKLYRFYLPVAAAALVVLAIGVGIWRSIVGQSDVNKGLVALQSAYRDQRPVQARITGFEYAPVLQTRGETPRIDYLQRDRARSVLFDAVAEHPSAAAQHALGQYYLSEREFDKAIDQFEAAVKLDPGNAQLHSDLGAALLERGKTRASDSEPGNRIEDFAASLEHLNRALELDGSLLPALFNRALLHQYMKLPLAAQNDWLLYLQKDSGSKWADEARQQLDTLNASPQKVSQSEDQALQDFLVANELQDDDRAWAVISWNYRSAGNAIANRLVDSYLDLQSKGDSTAARDKLQQLKYLAQLEFHHAVDHYTSDLVRYYENSSFEQRRTAILARAHIKKGYELFLASKHDSATRHYKQAQQAFAEIGDEGESIFADYLLGLCYLLQLDLKHSDEIFARLLSVCDQKSYRWLHNQSLYRTASIRLAYNEYSESMDYAHRALKQSEQIPDRISVLKLLILLGDQYRVLNNAGESLEYFGRALNFPGGDAAEPLQTWGIFTGIALNLNSLGSHRAALEYQEEALRLARVMNRPLIISRSYDYLGSTYASLAKYQDAVTNIDLAFDAAQKVDDRNSRREMLANSSLHAGDVHRQFGNFDQAVEAYDRSIKVYDDFAYTYYTYPAHKGKLLAFIAQGNDDATEAEIHTVLSLFEQYRSKLTSENQRNTFFDVEQSIYDLSIDFVRSKKQDERLAYDYSELSRARSLEDAIRQGIQVSERDDGPELRLPATSNPIKSLDIQRRMPEQAQIVQYAVLDNKLIIWVVNRSSVSSREVSVDAHALNEQVNEYVRDVNEPSASKHAQSIRNAQNLYSVLIKPVEPSLDRAKLLCIVPDKFLHYVPFAAVISPDSGHYLVEDFSLTQAPSSTVFVDCSELARKKMVDGEERLLSVGDPSFDPKAFPTLDRLPAAAREAESVAAFYQAPRMLLREEASERAVRREIGKANVLHFALHYLVDRRSSLLSRIALAAPSQDEEGNQADNGVWQVREIVQMKLPQARLVVLSACQTGIERQYKGEGAVSIARPFLVAGVPLVVATLWPVDSEATEKLMVSFHQHRTRDQLPTATALRRAQQEMIAGADTRYREPYYWAAFTAIGGYTSY
jgi:CHAT domain-containing protein